MKKYKAFSGDKHCFTINDNDGKITLSDIHSKSSNDFQRWIDHGFSYHLSDGSSKSFHIKHGQAGFLEKAFDRLKDYHFDIIEEKIDE